MMKPEELEIVVRDYFRNALQQGATHEDATMLLLSILSYTAQIELRDSIATATRYWAVNPVKAAN
jgi:hypothetical protein